MRIMRFMSYILKTPLLQSAFIPRPNRRGDNPEQFADFPLGHGGCAYVGRQGDIAVFIYRDDVPFFFHRYAVLR